jgi:hypothetical protein
MFIFYIYLRYVLIENNKVRFYYCMWQTDLHVFDYPITLTVYTLYLCYTMMMREFSEQQISSFTKSLRG